MAARINFGMIRYRHEIIRALMAEGHSVHGGDYLAVLNDDEDAHGTKQIKDELTSSRDKIYQAHCVAISTSPNPDDKQYKTLAKKSSRTVQENASLRKGELSRRYSEELVSSKLVELDDKGEYYKAQLHYYFTLGREFLPERDKQVIERQMAAGSGYIFVPDANRSLIGGKIKLLEALGINRLLQPDTEWTNDSEILIDLSIKCHQYAQLIKSLWGISIKKDDSPVLIAQKILRHCLGLSFATPIKRGAKGNQQRFYQAVEISSLRQSIIECWYLRDKEVKLAQDAAKVALDRRGFPSSLPPATHSNDTGVGGRTVSLDSDVEVGSTGNINTIPVVPTESAAYQDAAKGTELEQLVEALPFCETADDLACVIEGYAIEAVEDAIAMQDTQPRRLQLTKWLANATTEPIEPVLPSFKVGDALERLRGYSKGQVAQVLQVFQDWLETSLGAVTFDEIKSGSWLLIGST
jgi:hypothetical protein